MFKYIATLIVLGGLVGGGYYAWVTFEEKSVEPVREQNTDRQIPKKEEENRIPPGAVFEDGTIDEPIGDNVFHALISYTDDGYAPTKVTIKRGETVRFVNNAAEDSWPASAVHPTHGIYPEKDDSNCLGSSFDACRGLVAGEFWEFTFNETGTWRFHDHLHPYDTGSVVVE